MSRRLSCLGCQAECSQSWDAALTFLILPFASQLRILFAVSVSVSRSFYLPFQVLGRLLSWIHTYLICSQCVYSNVISKMCLKTSFCLTNACTAPFPIFPLISDTEHRAIRFLLILVLIPHKTVSSVKPRDLSAVLWCSLFSTKIVEAAEISLESHSSISMFFGFMG